MLVNPNHERNNPAGDRMRNNTEAKTNKVDMMELQNRRRKK